MLVAQVLATGIALQDAFLNVCWGLGEAGQLSMPAAGHHPHRIPQGTGQRQAGWLDAALQ
jgi:hypothetical protein